MAHPRPHVDAAVSKEAWRPGRKPNMSNRPRRVNPDRLEAARLAWMLRMLIWPTGVALGILIYRLTH